MRMSVVGGMVFDQGSVSRLYWNAKDEPPHLGTWGAPWMVRVREMDGKERVRVVF